MTRDRTILLNTNHITATRDFGSIPSHTVNTRETILMINHLNFFTIRIRILIEAGPSLKSSKPMTLRLKAFREEEAFFVKLETAGVSKRVFDQ